MQKPVQSADSIISAPGAYVTESWSFLCLR